MYWIERWLVGFSGINPHCLSQWEAEEHSRYDTRAGICFFLPPWLWSVQLMEAVSSIEVGEAPGALQDVLKVSVNFGA